ncbi:TPA: restriction endonuclease subunit S [Haemophilus influenzae]|uniref:restriction endonuclease subunit S n=1 Tax=Haemophilus influenzae TaxID=727 RepID=UPI00313D9F3A
MSDWKEYKLGELATFYNGRAYKNGEFKTSGTPIVRIQNLTGEGKTVYSDLQLDENKYIENGDLIYAWSATFGPYIWRGEKSIYHYHIWKIVCNEKIIDKFYFYYKLKLISDSLKDNGNGSIFVHITKSFMENFKIKIPSLEKQKYISNILSNLDKKIRFNTQINQTLEQIAQALFKSWFVDFDPVRAKVQALSDGLSLEQAELAAMQAISGKTAEELTALSQTQPERYAELAETAKAFPCEMVEVDGVELPKGWKIQYLKDICNIVYGKNLPTTKLIKEGYPVFGGNGVIGYYDKFLYETPQTLVSCRGAASGKVLYSLSYSFVTNNSLVIEHEKSGLSYFYIYETLKLQNLTELTSGSAQPQMTIANMAAVQILVPSEKINEVCKKYLGTLYNQIYQNNIENETLANTRDLLLPKLLKGEV